MRRDPHEDRPDKVREHDVECAVDVRGRSRSRVDRDTVRLGILFRRAHRERICVDADDLPRATLGGGDRENAGPGADVENAKPL